ncbi:iron-containing redox enzyme family protein [Pyxidicoccus fallax]|uniref:Iron-containing redox enzyme family protein n=1 Tax=Pyxidicoccus fallax TaxID=394095 RepID=A0A848LUA7_9BACT|nr:iron-containing redox enzyme family protein [Pyxidicoccus fallax]NMO21366.1 iron-containing redox enzyme family protein [Pyxidicoccus fallax]NPC82444.1 iron-containing redox enzyme family protein [Pyxidicoccus fallax]
MGAPSLVRNLKLRQRIASLKVEWNALEWPYLRALRDGSLSREDFVETQLHFFAAVAHFSRPMAVLASRLPRPDLRLPLVENVFDEHGRGELGHGHERTFRLLLERLGADLSRVGRAHWPEVQAFNAALTGVSTFDSPLTGLAMFGVIEDLFSGISLELGRGIVSRGWLPADKVAHYPTHATLDEEHADGFYRQLDAPYETDARSASEVEQGLLLGGHLFQRLYEDLYRARHRRDGAPGR